MDIIIATVCRLQSLYKIEARPGAPYHTLGKRDIYRMALDSPQPELATKDLRLSFWNIVASHAGYLPKDEESPVPALPLKNPGPSPALWSLVSFFERTTAFFLLLCVAPVLLVAAVVVIALSRRAPFVAHRRVGEGCRELWVLKLRTMWSDAAPPHPGTLLVERVTGQPEVGMKPLADPRVTSRFALFCRKYSIDELPQLWNVVRGEMAFVGPRPLTASELKLHYQEAAIEVCSSKPGITGLWQVKGRSRLTYRQRRRLDLFMIQHRSIRLYSSILISTIPRVVLGRDAW